MVLPGFGDAGDRLFCTPFDEHNLAASMSAGTDTHTLSIHPSHNLPFDKHNLAASMSAGIDTPTLSIHSIHPLISTI